jgi:3D (Asp-Asp-Asp) domain-containing protein
LDTTRDMTLTPATIAIVAAVAVSSPAVVHVDQQRPGLRRNAVLAVEATAYCDEGETASGVQTRKGIVAADPDILPLGSRIRVDGLGRRLSRTYDVEDTGRLVKGREIDIFMDDCGAAKEFGRRPARVRVLQIGDGKRNKDG